VIVMRSRTADADTINARSSRGAAGRPIVLLALQDDDVRAKFAYQLTALGFDVVTHVTADLRDTCRPDVIVAKLTAAQSGSASSTGIAAGDGRFRDIPVVAVADDVSDTTRNIARRHGCAAICLATCSAAALAAGIHAVLGG
jgi:DNA-binding NarL/FixJ family response regulator